MLALEWAPHGLTVNAIAPTWVYTPGTAERLDDPAFLASVLERIPIGRVATTSDVGLPWASGRNFTRMRAGWYGSTGVARRLNPSEGGVSHGR